jgi:hypothetical protein
MPEHFVQLAHPQLPRQLVTVAPHPSAARASRNRPLEMGVRGFIFSSTRALEEAFVWARRSCRW